MIIYNFIIIIILLTFSFLINILVKKYCFAIFCAIYSLLILADQIDLDILEGK